MFPVHARHLNHHSGTVQRCQEATLGDTYYYKERCSMMRPVAATIPFSFQPLQPWPSFEILQVGNLLWLQKKQDIGDIKNVAIKPVPSGMNETATLHDDVKSI